MNFKKCNEELVSHVKAMVDVDARVSVQEIADCLCIDSSSFQGSSTRSLAVVQESVC